MCNGGIREVGRPAKLATGGEVISVNEDLGAKPDTVNDDPHGDGWFVIVKPDDWDGLKGNLTPGTDVAVPYEAKMEAEGFEGCSWSSASFSLLIIYKR